MIDAVIRTGGKQYRVHEGSVLNVATLAAEPGSNVELRDVLLISDGDNVTIGNPNVPGAVVIAEVVEHGKGRKVVNFKFKAKTRYRRKRGHRQGFTRLTVRQIALGGPDTAAATAEAPAPRRRSRARTQQEEPVAAVEETPVVAETPPEPEAAPEAPTEAATPAPRRRRRTSSQTSETQE